MSGALHGLAAAAATVGLAGPGRSGAGRRRAWPALVLGAVWIKVAIEQLGGAPIANENWLGVAVITRSHLFGAGIGTLVGAASAWRRADVRAP